MGFGREFWPPSDTLDLMLAMRADLVPNFIEIHWVWPGPACWPSVSTFGLSWPS